MPALPAPEPLDEAPAFGLIQRASSALRQDIKNAA
jgi:hypothetical protein